MNSFETLFFLTIFLTFLIGTGKFLSFDKLVRLEYDFHRANWEKDGKPHGNFWVPPESRDAHTLLWKVDSTIARSKCMLAWALITPAWIQNEGKALSIIRWYRIFAAFQLIATLSMFYTFFRMMFG